MSNAAHLKVHQEDLLFLPPSRYQVNVSRETPVWCLDVLDAWGAKPVNREIR